MSNQGSGNGGASPKLQPMTDPASNDNSRQAPTVVSLKSTPAPTGSANSSGAPGPIAPDSKKGGQV